MVAWERATATPEQRAEIVANMQAAFAGVAEIGVGSERAATQQSSIGELEPVLAFGTNSSHFWVTASYADMARGAIWGAPGLHLPRHPWLGLQRRRQRSDRLGTRLGAANNHGVWAAVYWAPPRYTGGRW